VLVVVSASYQGNRDAIAGDEVTVAVDWVANRRC